MKTLLGICALLLATAVPVQAQDAPLAAVKVAATRDPVEKSFRKMMDGVALFEREHALAPQAQLRFKLLPRQPDTNMAGIVLKIVGDTFSTPIALDENNTFRIEANAQALKEDAAVMPNRRAASMTWRTDIRTPGLPPNTRRLGDMRLECQVGLEAGLISNRPLGLGTVALVVNKLADPCHSESSRYLFFADQPVFSVTLNAAGRREALSIHRLYADTVFAARDQFSLKFCDCQVMLDRTYFLPLGDPSWPDDTLIEFEYMQ